MVTKYPTENQKYLTLEYIYWPADKNTSSTYPLKTVSQAFDELKTGQGVLLFTPAKSQVSIATIYLAYFVSASYPQYLQPVYVFEGENFAAYVSAISSEFIAKSAAR